LLKRKIQALLLALMMTVFTQGSVFANVSYLGPAGTYTEEAAIKYFGEKEQLLPFTTVAEAVEQVLTGKTEYAVVPIENTIGGPVYSYLDLIMETQNLIIVGEITLPIRQTLLALPGSKLSDIKTVLSHPQGITQSTSWLKNNLPDTKVVVVSSTAEGAKKVAEGRNKSVAAIAASRNSRVYNLDILANDLQGTYNNATRFWVVTTLDRALHTGNKASLVVTGDIEKLPKLLGDFDQRNLKLVTIHDRPTKTKFGEYIFLVEVTTKSTRNALLSKLARVAKDQQDSFSIRVLGIYNESTN